MFAGDRRGFANFGLENQSHSLAEERLARSLVGAMT